MTKYAVFDHLTNEPSPVLQWVNTDGITSPIADIPLPAPPEDILEITENEWANRMARPWGIVGRSLVANGPPYADASPEEAAMVELGTRISAGITITCISNPFMDGVWALDDVTMSEIGAVARDYSSGLGLPGGGSTFTYPKADGSPVPMTGDQVVGLYQAQRDLLLVLNEEAAVMRNGGVPSWPEQSATIA